MKTTTTIARALTTGALALTTALALTACAAPAEPSADSGANRADVMFVQMMIPHHEGAIEMSDVLLDKSGVDPDVSQLAERIKAAQAPEIEQMEAWLDDWGMGSMGGMGHGGMDGMGADDEAELEAASGAEAGEVFLEQMIVHHEGAIDMAEDVLDDGEHPGVRDLAESIIESQAEEIELMRSMLES
ncbi:DUF305 domain-containing protein [Microcella daejeonensis]|uniref:DUF305 domain-containing protein n=1 Tax=Microcella daejeonensis TaxID=2994971 RepID=A0A9E8MJ20_9MICO|nr:DUF305 domain-containing protein [Microcella daejeonensis]WAB80460.1 DUF305 domain-containing protein [Microcella daejeonensis]